MTEPYNASSRVDELLVEYELKPLLSHITERLNIRFDL